LIYLFIYNIVCKIEQKNDEKENRITEKEQKKEKRIKIDI
jgi:hypothetical protein